MTNRLYTYFAILLLIPSSAAAQDKIAFSIAGVDIEAPLPTGYCLPTGRSKVAAELMAAADTANVTHASLFRCDQMRSDQKPGNDYYLLKTPREALVASISRAELIAALAAEFGKAEWQEGGAKISDLTANASQNLSETLNAPVDVKGVFAPRGADSDCAYLGGAANVSAPGISYPIEGGACMTSVGNKVLTVYAYDDPKGNDGIVNLMRKARALAVAFQPTGTPTP